MFSDNTDDQEQPIKKMDHRQKALESQGEEDANMVTAVEESRLLDRDVTMVRETETPRPTTAPTGIARPMVRDSPSLSEHHLLLVI